MYSFLLLSLIMQLAGSVAFQKSVLFWLSIKGKRFFS